MLSASIVFGLRKSSVDASQGGMSFRFETFSLDKLPYPSASRNAASSDKKELKEI
jgi:hypothetical protein